MEKDPTITTAEAPQGFSMMEDIRNSRLGRFVTAGIASLTLTPGIAAGALALNAEPVSADNVPSHHATENRLVIGNCTSTDSTNPNPQWHIRSNFEAVDSGNTIDSVRPGSVVKFMNRVTGGNVDSFNMEALTAAPIYHFPKSMEILKRGSHPAWSRAGSMPHWAIKNLCHWKDKRHISFLVKVDGAAKKGERLCMPYSAWARTGSNILPYAPSAQRSCLKVK